MDPRPHSLSCTRQYIVTNMGHGKEKGAQNKFAQDVYRQLAPLGLVIVNTLTHVLELLRVVEIYNMSLKSIVKESNTRRSFRCKNHKKNDSLMKYRKQKLRKQCLVIYFICHKLMTFCTQIKHRAYLIFEPKHTLLSRITLHEFFTFISEEILHAVSYLSMK